MRSQAFHLCFQVSKGLARQQSRRFDVKTWICFDNHTDLEISLAVHDPYITDKTQLDEMLSGTEIQDSRRHAIAIEVTTKVRMAVHQQFQDAVWICCN